MYRNVPQSVPQFGPTILLNCLQINDLGQFSSRRSVPQLSHSVLFSSHYRRICPQSRPNEMTANGIGSMR